MVMTLVVVSVMLALAGTALTVKSADKHEMQASQNRARSIYVAEAGVAEALGVLHQATLTGAQVPASFGNRDERRECQGGSYWSEITDNGDNTYTVRSTGGVNRIDRTLEVVVEVEQSNPLYDHSVFAGNVSGDGRYKMKFGGYGIEADDIDGDIYSGGDINVTGNADISGDLRAKGKITGPRGEEGVILPIPDIAGMNYEVNHDVDVAALFAAEETWRSDDAGGRAYQVPEENPAHIFRKNPNDRARSSNGKNDYFLEDPYEPVRRDVNWDGTDAYPITLTGTAGDPGPDTSEAVFFIDGNLWIHNIPTFSFKFVHDADEQVRVTFVVRGNITFSDNVFYDNKDTDGIAFIAMQDDQMPEETGNIYFGDPVGGTIEYMDGFMYAENDFLDVNLSASGSKRVTVNGNMTAGDQVRIERSYRNSHSKLTVQFDDRISSGELELPSLPHSSGGSASGGYTVLAWREVSSTYTDAPNAGGDYGGGGDSNGDDSGNDGGTDGGDDTSGGDGTSDDGGSNGNGNGRGGGRG